MNDERQRVGEERYRERHREREKEKERQRERERDLETEGERDRYVSGSEPQRLQSYVWHMVGIFR